MLARFSARNRVATKPGVPGIYGVYDNVAEKYREDPDCCFRYYSEQDAAGTNRRRHGTAKARAEDAAARLNRIFSTLPPAAERAKAAEPAPLPRFALGQSKVLVGRFGIFDGGKEVASYQDPEPVTGGIARFNAMTKAQADTFLDRSTLGSGGAGLERADREAVIDAAYFSVEHPRFGARPSGEVAYVMDLEADEPRKCVVTTVLSHSHISTLHAARRRCVELEDRAKKPGFQLDQSMLAWLPGCEPKAATKTAPVNEGVNDGVNDGVNEGPCPHCPTESIAAKAPEVVKLVPRYHVEESRQTGRVCVYDFGGPVVNGNATVVAEFPVPPRFREVLTQKDAEKDASERQSETKKRAEDYVAFLNAQS